MKSSSDRDLLSGALEEGGAAGEEDVEDDEARVGKFSVTGVEEEETSIITDAEDCLELALLPSFPPLRIPCFTF